MSDTIKNTPEDAGQDGGWQAPHERAEAVTPRKLLRLWKNFVHHQAARSATVWGVLIW